MKKSTLITWLAADAIIIAVIIGLIFGLWTWITARPQVKTNPGSQELRIVSIAPNLTEILYELGLEEFMVAVTSDSNYPAQVKQLPVVGSFWQPDMEAILTVRPTLVVALSFDQQASLVSRLQKLGCKTLSLNMETFGDLFSGIEDIGKVVNRVEESKKLVSQIQATQYALRQRFAGRAEPKVLWVIQREPLRVAGVDTYIDEMIRTCGGKNAITKTIQQYPPISQEALLAAAPDVIIEPADTPQDYERLTKTAAEFYGRYPSLPAVQNKRLYVLDGDLVSRLGPRIQHGMKDIAKCLWPQEKVD